MRKFCPDAIALGDHLRVVEVVRAHRTQGDEVSVPQYWVTVTSSTPSVTQSRRLRRRGTGSLNAAGSVGVEGRPHS